MRIVCEKLQLNFDSDFISKWMNYTKITGDLPKKSSRGSPINKIISLPRLPIEDSVLQEIKMNKDYQKALKLIGYNDV